MISRRGVIAVSHQWCTDVFNTMGERAIRVIATTILPATADARPPCGTFTLEVVWSTTPKAYEVISSPLVVASAI